MSAPLPANESQRLHVLREAALLDTAPEREFDDIAQLAATVCGTPLALITLVDETRQWFKSRVGIEFSETPREFAFCAHAILDRDLMLVPDATRDERFAANPYVVGEPHIRFYAGAPLVTESGEALGALCVLDRRPRELDETQRRALRVLSQTAMTLIRLRRLTRLQAQLESGLQRSESAQRALAERLRVTLESMTDAFFTLDAAWRFTYLNNEAERVLQRRRSDLIGRVVWEAFPEAVGSTFEREYREAVASARAGHFVEFYPPLQLWFDVHAYPSAEGLAVYFRNVTDRVRAEREAAHAGRALRMLSRCNEALVRAGSEVELLTRVCTIAVEIGGFKLAWVGYAENDAARSIVPRAHAGTEEGYLSTIRLSWAEDQPAGRGPAGKTIRTGQPVVIPDVREPSAGFHYLAEAVARGYRGIVTLPLTEGDRAFGVLALYMAENRTPPDEELNVLRELADNLAFGIRSLRAETERNRAHEAVLTMARGLSAAGGPDFFAKLALTMVDSLDAQAGFVAQIDVRAQDRIRAAATIVAGRPETSFTCRLADLPCADFAGGDTWITDRDAGARFPDAPLLREYGFEACVGAKLVDAQDRPLGAVFVFFAHPLRQTDFLVSALRIFAARAAAEFQRQIADAKTREQAALLDKAQDAILVRNLDHRITFWNRSAERLYGWTAEEAVGRSVRTLLYADGTAFDRATECVVGDGEWTGELEHVAKGGKRIVIEGHWTLVRDEDGQPTSVLAINTDITERKALESRFLRAQRLESIGTLAGGIAHDLNNLLVPIAMGVDLLTQAPNLTPEDRAIVASIEKSARRCAGIVKQVLSFARGVEGRRVATAVPHVIGEIQSIVQNTFPKNITLRLELAPDLPAITVDPTHLHQAVLNLCVNARDAMPHGGRLTVSALAQELDEPFVTMNGGTAPGHYVVIAVADTGTGIPREIVDRIFDPFFTTKGVGQGTGLGLSTVLGIVRSHGGFVSVASEPGKGSTFRLYWPTADAAEIHDTAANQVDAPRGRGELVLVVDDEPPILEVTGRTLETHGYRVLTAEDGADAIAKYAQHWQEVAAVLTDMMMPVMDGVALAHALRRINSAVTLVAASGVSSREDLARAASAGVKHFIAKPYSARALLSTLHAAIAESTPPDGASAQS